MSARVRPQRRRGERQWAAVSRWGFGPRLSGAETPSAGNASTAGLRESGSGCDLAEAERACGWQLAKWEIFFEGGVGVSDIYEYVDDVKPRSVRHLDSLIIALPLK